MQLYRKVQAVERAFRALGREVDAFQKAAGISCIPGCSACCTYERIFASTLEFLPLAYHLYRRGRAPELLESLASGDRGKVCAFFDRAEGDSEPGRCAVYPHRGLSCRLFGFSGVADRKGRTRYATCRGIKERDRELFLAVDAAVGAGRIPIPSGNRYHLMLSDVDPGLMAYRPVNVAIRNAVESVLGYYSYRRRR